MKEVTEENPVIGRAELFRASEQASIARVNLQRQLERRRTARDEGMDDPTLDTDLTRFRLILEHEASKQPDRKISQSARSRNIGGVRHTFQHPASEPNPWE